MTIYFKFFNFKRLFLNSKEEKERIKGGKRVNYGFKVEISTFQFHRFFFCTQRSTASFLQYILLTYALFQTNSSFTIETKGEYEVLQLLKICIKAIDFK